MDRLCPRFSTVILFVTGAYSERTANKVVRHRLYLMLANLKCALCRQIPIWRSKDSILCVDLVRMTKCLIWTLFVYSSLAENKCWFYFVRMFYLLLLSGPSSSSPVLAPRLAEIEDRDSVLQFWHQCIIIMVFTIFRVGPTVYLLKAPINEGQ